MRNYGIACGDDFLTMLYHTFVYHVPDKNAVPTSRQNGVVITLLPLFPQPAVFQAR